MSRCSRFDHREYFYELDADTHKLMPFYKMTLTISASSREACLVPSHCVRVRKRFRIIISYWLGLHRDPFRTLFPSSISLSPSLFDTLSQSFYPEVFLISLAQLHLSLSLLYTFNLSHSPLHPLHVLALDRISSALRLSHS